MYVAVLIGGSDYRMYWIPARPDVFEVLKEKCQKFWVETVQKKIPPEPINIEDVLKLYKKSNGQAIEATGALAEAYGEYSRLDGEIKALKAQQTKYKEVVVMAMKDNDILTLGGTKVLSFKSQTAKRFDLEKFKEDHLDDYFDYLKESSTRVVRLSA